MIFMTSQNAVEKLSVANISFFVHGWNIASFQIQGLWSRFFPVYHKLREQLKENAVGKVNYVTANFGANIQRFARLKEKSLGGGCVLDLGVYAIQMALLVYDHEEPEKIIASGILNDQGNKW